MVKKTVCYAFILLVAGWMISRAVFSARARLHESLLAENTMRSTAQQSTPPVNAAERDEAIAEIKKRIAGHEDEPAEQVFKNIEILKGKNASRLPLMMSALTGLLGVNCTYCHVKNRWDSEAKPTKQIARKMFKMIKGINGDYFEGRNAVSCWTCHRGSPHPPIQG